MSLFTHHSIRADSSGFPYPPIVSQWLAHFEIDNTRTAHLICALIPSTCPFERNVSLFHRTVHIPALCNLNPLYDDLVALRFRALNYLTEVCGEDITQYLT